MIETLQDLSFNDKFKLYNSERREQVFGFNYYGPSSVTEPYYDWNDGFDFSGVQKLYLDCRDTSVSQQKEVVLFTLSNGVYLKGSYYLQDNLINMTLQYYSKDDESIGGLSDSTSMFVWLDDIYTGDTIDHVEVQYMPLSLDYGYLSQSEHPSAIRPFFITRRPNDTGLYPVLNGEIDRAWFGTNYQGATVSADLRITDLAEFIDKMTRNGDGTPISPILPSDDTSDPGGGDEDDPAYDPFSDPVDFPDMPTGGDALSSGFIRAYTPTSSQLQSIARKLWSDDFVETIKKIQNDPMEAIISLHSIPFSVGSGNAHCVVGNYDTEISVPVVGGQFNRRNLGSIRVPEHWASALDYSPYVTIDIFLPYVGVRSLQVDDIIGRTITVEYLVDVLTGSAVCHIKCGDSVLYSYNCNMAMQIPMSMSSMGPLLQSIMGASANIINGAVASGIGGAVGGALGSAINVATSKHSQISRGSSLGGNFGCLSNFVPYLIIHRPIQSLASGFAHFKGYPSNITATIGSVSGYSEVESVHLTGIPCTDIERDEINALLYNGVIV